MTLCGYAREERRPRVHSGTEIPNAGQVQMASHSPRKIDLVMIMMSDDCVKFTLMLLQPLSKFIKSSLENMIGCSFSSKSHTNYNITPNTITL